MAKFYAVRKGLNTGIYTSWDEAEKNVKGFPGAEYKKFSTLKDALSLGEMHEFKNTIAYENIKNLIQNLPLKDPGEIHFYKVENALIDDPWRCDDTGCIESLI